MTFKLDKPLSLKQLKRYINFLFPSCVAQEDHNPYFDLEKPEEWLTPGAIKFFEQTVESEESNETMNYVDFEEESLDILKAYRTFILPPQTALHPFFKIGNAGQWIQNAPFKLFVEDYNLSTDRNIIHHPVVKQEASKEHPIKQEFPTKISALGKRKAEIQDRDIIVISDDDDSPPPAKLARRVSKKSKKHAKDSSGTSTSVSAEVLDLTLLSDAERKKKPAESKHTNATQSEPAKPPHWAHQTKPSRPTISRSKNAIRVSKKESVKFVKHIDDIPILWDVPRQPTAYVIDLSKNLRFEAGKSIISWIRHEDQSSWEGSFGHKAGNSKVFDLFGEENVLCRRASFECKGIKVCEFIDQELLDGFEGWERDDTEMASFWQSELDGNEDEFRDSDGPLSRFYTRVMNSKCKVQCNGKPVIRNLKKPSVYYGKTTFIGCSAWRLGDSNTHRCIQIDQNLDEALVADMLANDGKLPTERKKNTREDGRCSLVLHPRSHQTHCSFTHIIDGKVKRGKIEPYGGCTSRLIIYEPVDPSIRKAIVLPMNPHNHPRHPHAKPTLSEKEFVKAASKASGEAKISAKALRNSATTASMLQGETWESQVPGLVDHQRLRKCLDKINRETFPRGLNWEGIQYEVDQRESKLPKEKRYIHTVTSKGDVRLVVTMHPGIVKYIHSARFLALDYTFKRVHGDMNEWEVSGNIDRFKKRVTYASLYCNKATRDAFGSIFQEFFDTVERVTGEKLDFFAFNSNARLHALLFDAEPAQMQGCGDNLVRMNDPEVSGIKIKDPLVIVQHFAKTCVQHFYRNLDDLPKNIPRDVINHLKSFPGLNSNEDIVNWHNLCKASEYPAVINWYKQKLAHPWYLPSLNRFLSPMLKESWDITPNDTNIAETAHAARNAETKINRPLLAAILDARLRDEQIAKQLEHFESNFTTGDRFNLPYNREKRSAARRESTHQKVKTVGAARAQYEALEIEVNELAQKRKESLERSKKIGENLTNLKAELSTCSKVSILAANLKNDQAALQKELQEELANRKEWSARSTQLKEDMKNLKEDKLKNARVHDARPTSSSPAPGSSPQKEGKPTSPTRSIIHSILSRSPLKQTHHNFVDSDSNTPDNSLDISDIESTNPFEFPPEETPPASPFIPQTTEPSLTDSFFRLFGHSTNCEVDPVSLGSTDVAPEPEYDFLSTYAFLKADEQDQAEALTLTSEVIMDRFLSLYPENL